jgi:hypothetical protein
VLMMGLRSMMMTTCLRSMTAAGLRSMMVCSGLELSTVTSSEATVKDGGGVLAVNDCVLWAEIEDNGSMLTIDGYVLWVGVNDGGPLLGWGRGRRSAR